MERGTQTDPSAAVVPFLAFFFALFFFAILLSKAFQRELIVFGPALSIPSAPLLFLSPSSPPHSLCNQSSPNAPKRCQTH
jgi:hypothetical protein